MNISPKDHIKIIKAIGSLKSLVDQVSTSYNYHGWEVEGQPILKEIISVSKELIEITTNPSLKQFYGKKGNKEV